MSTFNRIESAWCIYRNARKWGYFLTQREQLPSAVQHGCGLMPTNLFWLSCFLSFFLSLSLSFSCARLLALLSTFLSTKPCQTLIITSPSLSAAINTNREQERERHTRAEMSLGLWVCSRGWGSAFKQARLTAVNQLLCARAPTHSCRLIRVRKGEKQIVFETLLDLIRAVCRTISIAHS